MPKKTRRILFLIAVVAFVATGFVLTMYARGYRWDFKNNKFLLVGAIYIEPANPENTQISVNNKLTDKLSASLIKNLLPLRKYDVKVAKADYQTWAKEFEITPGLVVEAKNINLFPSELKTNIIWPNANIEDFTVSPNQEIIIAKTSKNELLINFFPGGNNPSTITPLNFGDKTRTWAIGLSANSRGWSDNSQKLVFWRNTALQARNKKTWYVWDSETKSLTDINNLYERKIVLKNPSATPLPKKFDAGKVIWLGNENLIAQIGKKLFQLDIKNETVTDLNLSDILDFDIEGNKIIALKSPDILLALDSSIQNITILGQAKFVPEKVLISPDESKIAYFNKNQIGVMWLKNTNNQPAKKNGDQDIILSDKNITSFYWHSSNEYLVFVSDNKFYSSEIDIRGQVNLATWPNVITVIGYIPKDQKLYILEDKTLKLLDQKF